MIGAVSYTHLDDDLPVEPAGTHQGRIQDIRAVGRGDHDDALVRAEAVHLDEQLVEGLLPFVMPAAEARAALTADRVDFIDEDDAGRALFRLVEQIPDTGRADADIHLHKIRARNREERHPRLPRDGAGQQGFTGTGRAHQQHPFGDPGAELFEFFG